MSYFSEVIYSITVFMALLNSHRDMTKPWNNVDWHVTINLFRSFTPSQFSLFPSYCCQRVLELSMFCWGDQERLVFLLVCLSSDATDSFSDYFYMVLHQTLASSRFHNRIHYHLQIYLKTKNLNLQHQTQTSEIWIINCLLQFDQGNP